MIAQGSVDREMPTNRQMEILNLVVDQYITDFEPVPSDVIASSLSRPVSSATIRSEMALLESLGYITRPHKSAGGIPSEKAYRTYVESLDVEEPPRQVQDDVEKRFKQSELQVEARSRIAVKLLSSIVQTLAMITLPTINTPRWRHLELIYLRDFLALMVMVLDESRIVRKVITLHEALTQDQLGLVSSKLNTIYSGFTHKQFDETGTGFEGVEEGLLRSAVDLLKPEYDSGPMHMIDGLRHMFTYPELSSSPMAQSAIELVEDTGIMPDIFAEASDTGDVKVKIGMEHGIDQLRHFSVVYSRYGDPLESSGVVAIIGPTRMRYPKAISNVRYFSQLMTNMLGSSHGWLS